MSLPGIPMMLVNDDIDERKQLVKQFGEQNPNLQTMRNSWPEFVITSLQVSYYQTMYDKIIANGVPMQITDKYALGMLAINLALVDECVCSIEELGMNMEYRGDRKMVLKRNPALDVLKDAQAAVRFYLKEFRMTPNSRGKNQLGQDKAGIDADGFDGV